MPPPSSIHGIVPWNPGLSCVLRRFGGIIRSIQTESPTLPVPGSDGRHHDFHAGGISGGMVLARGFVQQGVGIDIKRGDDLQTALSAAFPRSRWFLPEFLEFKILCTT